MHLLSLLLASIPCLGYYSRVGQYGKEHTIPRPRKIQRDTPRALPEPSSLRPNPPPHILPVQIPHIGTRRLRITLRFPDIINIEIRSSSNRPLNLVRTDPVRGPAGLVCSCTRAVVDSGKAGVFVCGEIFVSLGGGDQRAVSVVICEVDVRFFLDAGIDPGVVYAQGY